LFETGESTVTVIDVALINGLNLTVNCPGTLVGTIVYWWGKSAIGWPVPSGVYFMVACKTFPKNKKVDTNVIKVSVLEVCEKYSKVK